MTTLIDILWTVLSWAAALGMVGWGLFKWYQTSNDESLIVKWLLSALVIAFMIFGIGPMMAAGGLAAVFGVLLGAVCGAVLAVLWTGNIASVAAGPFTNLFFPKEEMEAKPFYSTAEYRRKQGRYQEAIKEVENQLEQFPSDPRGHFLLAEIQAENFKDLNAAQQTAERFMAQPGHDPKNHSFILNRLADWYLRFEHDPDSAREFLQRIIDQFPDTEMAHMATQRIAHLPDRQQFGAKQPIKVPHIAGSPGVDPNYQRPQKPTEDLGEIEERYLRHLAERPDDQEAREELAHFYAEHRHDVDRAIQEVEALLETPGAPQRQVVHWLNMLADLQIKYRQDVSAARRALERIIELYPGTAVAATAERRISLLNRELNGRKQAPSIKMASYDQRPGLRKNRNAIRFTDE